MLRLIKRHLANLRRVALSVESADVVVAREALLKKENQADPSRLGRFEYQVYSQNGEDGIISEIFNRIGETNRKCVEIGVAHNENNTLHLLNQGWSGLWLDLELDKGDFAPALMDMVREGRLKAESVWKYWLIASALVLELLIAVKPWRFLAAAIFSARVRGITYPLFAADTF